MLQNVDPGHLLEDKPGIRKLLKINFYLINVLLIAERSFQQMFS